MMSMAYERQLCFKHHTRSHSHVLLIVPSSAFCCAADCTFANLGGDGSASAACAECTGNVIAEAPVHIVNSTFFDPVRRPLTTYVRAGDNGSVLLTGCTFGEPSSITDPLFYAQDSAVIYTDDTAAIRVRTEAGGTATASPVSLVPELPAVSSKSFPQRSDPWFVSVMRVRSPESF